MKRPLIVVLAAAALAGCGEAEPPPPATAVAGGGALTGGGAPTGERMSTGIPPVSWSNPPNVEPAEAQVFLRKPVPDAGPGRELLHVLVAPGATEDQIRLALTDVLTRTAKEDTTVVALRAIAYVVPAVQADEVELVPAGWAEWVPPQGWAGATAASRREFHRIYTYFGAPPPW